MKKIIIAAALIAVTHSLMAQKITFGLKAGANITNFTGIADSIKKNALVGFHAGAFLNFKLGHVSLQSEVLVSTAGAKFEKADSSFRLIYLTVPVMLKLRSTAGFYFEIGPQVGFKLNEDISNQTTGNFAKNLDLSAGAGIGFQSKGGFGIGGRYLLGLSKVGDFNASTTKDPDFKNSVIQVGISFPLTK
jgi:Outer membrane protein beta-barrel domain